MIVSQPVIVPLLSSSAGNACGNGGICAGSETSKRTE
jgi:hypothetical protein